MPDAQVANAGVANGKAFERSFLGGPRAAWGSQNPEGEWPCRARGAAPPREAWFPYLAGAARRQIREGVAGRNVPLRFSLACLGFSFLFRGVQRGYFSFQSWPTHIMKQMNCRCPPEPPPTSLFRLCGQGSTRESAIYQTVRAQTILASRLGRDSNSQSKIVVLVGLLPTTSEDDSCAQPYLVLAVSLKVAEFGVKVVRLNGTYPDVF
jgi:hypothetical protein